MNHSAQEWLEPQPGSMNYLRRWTAPNFPENWEEFQLDLRQTERGRELLTALESIPDTREPRFLRELKEVWDGFEGGREISIGEWPLHLLGLRALVVQVWAMDYWALESLTRWDPATAKVVEEDWRYQFAQWYRSRVGPRPGIERMPIPCPEIPKWVEGQTRLVLMPTPGFAPPWLPGIVHAPDSRPILGEPLRLVGYGTVLELDGLRDLAFTPEDVNRIGEQTPESHPGPREWLLRLAHLQRAAWTAVPWEVGS